jgi:hypothetical protein
MASIDDAMILPHAANLDGSNFRKGRLQNVGHRLQPAGADAGSALFVFLHLLEGQAEVVAQLFLAHAWHRRIRTRFPTCLSTGLGPLVAIVISAGPYFLMSQFKHECNRTVPCGAVRNRHPSAAQQSHIMPSPLNPSRTRRDHPPFAAQLRAKGERPFPNP